MGKVKKAATKWVKQAYKDIKKDPTVISRGIARAEKRIKNISGKASTAIAKAKAGDSLGSLKSVHETYRAAVGGKMHKKLLEENKGYRRAHNIGGKTFKAAEAFKEGNHDMGYKHAMDAARAAVGKAKLDEIKSKKSARMALAAMKGYEVAKGTMGSTLSKVGAGLEAYEADRKRRKEKKEASGQGTSMRKLLGGRKPM
jgi:hypothetical protein